MDLGARTIHTRVKVCHVPRFAKICVDAPGKWAPVSAMGRIGDLAGNRRTVDGSRGHFSGFFSDHSWTVQVA